MSFGGFGLSETVAAGIIYAVLGGTFFYVFKDLEGINAPAAAVVTIPLIAVALLIMFVYLTGDRTKTAWEDAKKSLEEEIAGEPSP